MLNEITVLTYCHKCNKVHNDQHEYCPACGSCELLICVPGPAINDWLESELKLESVKYKQCGCCDYFLYDSLKI